MDNLAHTLAGAALGEAGLKEKTGLGLATLMIAANLPDVDALGLLVGENLAWRRGWTHGPIAMLLLPLLLTAAMIGFDRWQARRGTRPAARLPVRPGWLLALAYIGTLSHPVLDFLNTYGIRCLMPFSERWFYGDTLFIIDVWVWTTLALGVGIARHRRKHHRAAPRTPALAAIALVTLYTAAMAGAGRTAEAIVARAARAEGLPVAQVLASPVPVDPFRRDILLSTGTHYRFGEVRWRPGARLVWQPQLVPINMNDPAVASAAAQSKELRDFLYWSRFPFAQVERAGATTRVRVSDGRYATLPTGGRFTREVTLETPPKGR